MRDARKFCRPKITKNPKLGDVYIKLKCGQTAPISAEEYNKIKKYFKVDSVVGSSPSIGGNLIVKSKLLGVLTVISPEDFDPDIFEVLEVIGEKVAGYEYVDLGLPSGTLWAAMNVGASSETDYGNYYQYGKGAAQYADTNGDSNYSGTEDPLTTSVDTAAQVWGGSWHMPTRAQMQELTANTTYQWVRNYKGSGINGCTFTATNGAVLFIPAAGYWYGGSQSNVGNVGNYWGSSPDGSGRACDLGFGKGYKSVASGNRFYGFSVRGVKDPSSEDNKPLAEIGDVLVHNTILNIDSILSFNDWINANDSWEITGLYGIETFEEEDAVGGEYIIMANGHTLIIKPEDYSKVSNNWEKVDEIPIPVPEHEYVEIAGIKWATMNIGASQPSDYGLYFAWGDTQGYTAEQVGSGEGQKYFGWADYKYGNGTSSPGATGMTKYNATDGKTVLEASDDAAVANWGGSWRMPTTAEFQALGAAVNTAWTQVNNVYGILCTDKTDSSKTLFFPAAGFCENGNVEDVGNGGYYWSSSLSTDDRQGAYRLLFSSYSAYWDSSRRRNCGYVVRGVLDE